MKKLAIAFAASLFFSTSAMAQAPGVDPATAQAVGELLVAMKYQDVMKSSMHAMHQQMPLSMLQGASAAIENNPKLSVAQKAERLEKAKQEIARLGEAMGRMIDDPALMTEMGAEMVPLYARHFTLDEIRQMTALYRSPLGAKMLTTMPVLMQEGMQFGQRVMAPRLQAMMQQLQTKQ